MSSTPSQATQPKTPQNNSQILGSGTDEDPWRCTTENGNFIWNNQLQAWVPQLDETLIQQQQAIYQNTSESSQNAEKSSKQKKRKNRGKPQISYGSVFVQGLPPDAEIDEIATFFSKTGVIAKDPESAEFRIKLYHDDKGKFKGEALVTYLRHEAVALTIQISDGAEFRPGYTLKIEEAKFDHKAGEKKKKKSKPSKKVKLLDQSQELSWEENTNSHVIIKNMFTQEEAWKEPNFFTELEEDVYLECSKLGPVNKVKIFERNPEGVVAVKFGHHYAAQRCIDIMNGRWFAGKKLQAELYDGFTNYYVRETEEQEREREEAFDDWLEQE